RAGETVIRFYPSPGTRRIAPDKRVREASWFSETLFMLWLNGGQWRDFENAVELDGHSALVSADEADLLRTVPALYDTTEGRFHLWNRSEVPRVAVDRVNGASNVFQVGRLRFAAGGGLWCAFDIPGESTFPVERLQT